MKEKLLSLLVSHPAAAGQTAGQLDDLAEDILAVIIRAFAGSPEQDLQLTDLEHRVHDVFVNEFGASLHNLLHFGPDGRPLLYFSARNTVTKAVIQTLLLEYGNHFDRNKAATLKARLAELAPEAVSAVVN